MRQFMGINQKKRNTDGVDTCVSWCDLRLYTYGLIADYA